MRVSRMSVLAVGALVSTAACGGTGSSSVVSDPPQPSLSSTASSPAAGSSAPATKHRPRHHTTRASASPAASPSANASSAAAPSHSPAPTTRPPTHRPSPTHSSSPSHHPSPSPTSSCAGTIGSTTTVQEQSGDKFAPSSVTVSRCDSVKAVYSDTTGTSHSFTGPGWDSGAMNPSGTTSYTYKFVSKGTFNFYCTYHKSFGMTGTITVT